MKILCIGEALIDMICTDKGRALSDGDNFLKKPGGAPTNVAAAIAALGGSVSLVTKVGTDPFGRHLVQVMQSFGVSTEYMKSFFSNSQESVPPVLLLYRWAHPFSVYGGFPSSTHYNPSAYPSFGPAPC